MKSQKNNVTAFWKSLFACLLLSAFLIMPAEAEEERYVFERMWPELQQPWYFSHPSGVAVDKNGNVYVTDSGNDRIQKFASDGTFITRWGNRGLGDGQFNNPTGIAVDSGGDIYVVDSSKAQVQKFSSNGTFIIKWGSEGLGDGQFKGPVGIAIDGTGFVYVADMQNNRIQKFDSDGNFISKWGSFGSGDGQFSWPTEIAVDSTGFVYVVDSLNSRIQKFDLNGNFIGKWGSFGSGDGQFNGLTGIAVDSIGIIYILDANNKQIQKFTSDGAFIAKWGNSNSGEGQFRLLEGIAVDSAGFVYVVDTFSHNIRKFSSDGTFISKWESEGSGDGQFYWPEEIAVDSTGFVYVADPNNNRIQKFSSDGTFISKWGSGGSGDGQFVLPRGIAVDSAGFVYVADSMNDRIQKFKSDGAFISKWGSYGSENGQFYRPEGIAVDGKGFVYVADPNNNRIQKFSSDGTFISKWGSEGSGDGQFSYPNGIALDGDGFVYVADYYNQRIQKFGSGGIFISKWGNEGSGDGQFSYPNGIALDGAGFIYVLDSGNSRIQKFGSDGNFITKFGGFGSDPGLLNVPMGICISTDGRVYVADTKNNRIQVFRKAGSTQKISKAIIVAGSGPGDWNNLWDATQICANYAYVALLYQGFTKENIYYLTHDANSDDRDAPATNAEFQKAITDWAKDPDNVFIYMVGHGGEGTFRMGAAELLQAADLDTWLDTLQGIIPGRVILVYDACRSGSFLSVLKPPSGKQRILVASASSSQEAIFATQGKVSFSFMFWASLFNGDSFYDCFKDAKKTVALTYLQASQLDANGNGVPNEEEDQEIARSVIFGNETLTAGDIPLIAGLSPAQTLNGETSALIYAENVIDADGIGRVWAVIMPPGYSSDSPETPVTTLPTVDLKSVGNNRYEVTYTGFDTAGIYNIAVFAIDQNVVIGDPVQTTVTQTKGAVLKGDINDDKAVNLADALVALKAAVNYSEGPLPIRADYVSSGVDINGDSKIGAEEVIYILQKTAAMR